MAGFEGGTLLLTFNDSIQTEVDYSPTNGWQNWADFTTNIFLEEGFYTLQVHAQSAGFNINYYDFELLSTSVQNESSVIHHIEVYPNPVKELLNVEFSANHSQDVTIKLIDLTGKTVQEFHNGDIAFGSNRFTFSLNPNLPKGTYFIEIKDPMNRHFKKIIKD